MGEVKPTPLYCAAPYAAEGSRGVTKGVQSAMKEGPNWGTISEFDPSLLPLGSLFGTEEIF